MTRFALALIPLLLVCCPCGLLAQRVIPDDNLAYPVLITLTDCTGNVAVVRATGFFLDTHSEEYLVTARHVLFNETEPFQAGQARAVQCKKAELLSYSKDPKERQQNQFQLDLQALNEAGKVKFHAAHDVAVVRVGASKPDYFTPSPELRVLQTAPSGILSVDIDTARKLDEVLTANDVYVLGYPSSIGVEQLQQIDYNTPLLRKGVVAGINTSKRTIILDCLTFQGNSGGPVLQVCLTRVSCFHC